MPALIFLTGFTGIGKTTIASSYPDRAWAISGDDVHRDAARRAFPYIRKSELYNWLAWPEDPLTMHLELLLFVSLQSVAPGLREHNGDILIEGTFLGNSWFRYPLISALAASGQKFNEEDIHLLYLRPSHDDVHANIQGRLQTTTGRALERSKLSDSEAVANELETYEKFVADDNWQHFSNSDDVHTAIESILQHSNHSSGGSGKPNTQKLQTATPPSP